MGGVIEVDYPVMSPGTCFICTGGPSPDRRWFDTLIDVWKKGRFYICSMCVENLADLLDLNPNQQLVDKIEQMEVENERGKRALAVLSSLRVDFGALDLDSPVGEVVPTEGIKGAKESASK